jgi:predicted porin
MKKSLIAIAALAATSAFAQSSVTISGVADFGLQYNNQTVNAAGVGNGTGANKLQLGAGNNNRIIFAGVEDLGGGMATTFAFQLRLDPGRGNEERGTNYIGYAATGTTAATSGTTTSRPLFQGESTVGLRGGFGALRLGRMLPANQMLNGGTIDPWGVSTVGGNPYQTGFVSDYVQGGEGRIGNAATYATPNFSGFQGLVTLGFDKGPANKSYSSYAASYRNGPIAAMFGMENNRFGDKLTNIGANYDLGAAKLYAGYGAVKGGTAAERAGATFLATAAGQQVAVDSKVTILSFGANIPFGAATGRVGYANWTGNGGAVGNSKESKFSLGVNYALSKRTAIYSDIANTTRKSAALAAVTQFDLGIAHSF